MKWIPLTLLVVLLHACATPEPPPQPITVSLSVNGMHCVGCAWTITEALEELDGVERCTVSFEEGRAELLLDPRRVTADEVASVIGRLGYNATLPGVAPVAPEEPVLEAPPPTTAVEPAAGVAAPDAAPAAVEPAEPATP